MSYPTSRAGSPGRLAALLLSVYLTTSCDESLPVTLIVEIEPVDISVEPGALSFSDFPVGESESQVFTITNLSTVSPLLMTAIELDLPRGFQLVVRDDSRARLFTEMGGILNVREIVELELIYSRSNSAEVSGSIVFHGNIAGGGPVILPVTAFPATGQLETTPSQLVCLPAREGLFQKEISAQNVGGLPIEVTGVELLSESGNLRVEYDRDIYGEVDAATPLTLEPFRAQVFPGDSDDASNEFRLSVVYEGVDTLPAMGTLRIHADNSIVSMVEIQLDVGNGPVLHVQEGSVLDFGTAKVGRLTQRTIVLENQGLAPLSVSEIRLDPDSDPAFSLDVDGAGSGALGPDQPPVELAAGETYAIEVDYVPDLEISHYGRVQIVSNTCTPEYDIRIRGTGELGIPCPRASAVGSILGGAANPSTQVAGLPLQTLLLDGSGSVAQNGTGLDFFWELIERPSGSTSALMQSTPAEQRLLLDVVGRYVIELTVIDGDGLVSCDSARVVVDVAPPATIHVQLLWDNPDDPDQTDFNGSDLDLHFSKMPVGRWFQAPYDITFANTAPFWDPETPTLDIDDPNGAGPENISLDNPADCTWYAVGVHQWRQHFGTAFATIRIYTNGQLAFEEIGFPLPSTDDFLDVARIHWPSGTVLRVGELSERSMVDGQAAPVTEVMQQSGLCGVPTE